MQVPRQDYGSCFPFVWRDFAFDCPFEKLFSVLMFYKGRCFCYCILFFNILLLKKVKEYIDLSLNFGFLVSLMIGNAKENRGYNVFSIFLLTSTQTLIFVLVICVLFSFCHLFFL